MKNEKNLCLKSFFLMKFASCEKLNDKQNSKKGMEKTKHFLILYKILCLFLHILNLNENLQNTNLRSCSVQ